MESCNMGRNKSSRQQFQELKKAGINTSKGRDIIESINNRPAFTDLVGRMKEIMSPATAEQAEQTERKYLVNGKMYPVILAFSRQKIEETGFGYFIVTINPDRRIYAVLKPTSAEDFHRIQVILNCAKAAMDSQEYDHFWLSLNDYRWAIRIANKYDEGQISYEMARDLLDAAFSPGQD